MHISDVPLSGLFYQEGAVATLVASILDPGLNAPVNLAAATSLSIAVGYPDGVTTQTLIGSLLTDGSDGTIKASTRNNGTTIVDLTQPGLYTMQALAIIGGVQYIGQMSDFYVETNIEPGQPPTPPPLSSSAMIFFDANGIRWAMVVSTGGLLSFVARPSGPSSSLYLTQVVMKDPSGIYWQMGVSLVGAPTAQEGGSFAQALESFILTDTSGKGWVITVTEGGAWLAS